MRPGFITMNLSRKDHLWNGATPRVKKFKSQHSAGKIMATVFWDIEGVILADFMSQGTTINSDVYTDTLRKLKARD